MAHHGTSSLTMLFLLLVVLATCVLCHRTAMDLARDLARKPFLINLSCGSLRRTKAGLDDWKLAKSGFQLNNMCPDSVDPDQFSPLSKLDLTITQSSRTPSRVTVKLTNNNAVAVTLAPYGNPLDENAIDLGYFRIPARSYSKAPAEHSPLSCLMFPCPKLITFPQYTRPRTFMGIDPGQSQERDFDLTREGIQNGTEVVVEGFFGGVWAKDKNRITRDLRHGLAWKGEQWLGRWESNTIVLTFVDSDWYLDNQTSAG